MIRVVFYSVLAVLISTTVVYAQSGTESADAVFAAAPDILLDPESLRKLREEISDASPEQFFAVHLVFDEPVSIEEIHTASLQLRIPRVLAYVEYGPLIDDRPRNLILLGLGEMYASEAAQRHTRCRALISVGYGETNELRDQPIGDWVISKFQVQGTAHAIRELQSGSILPAARIVDGQTTKLEHVQILAAYTRDEVSKKIDIPSNFNAPDECEQDVAPIDAPILVAGMDPSLRQLPWLEDDDFRKYAFRVLGTLPPDSAVTVRLKLDFPADVDVLASLVWQYGIEGMSAELVPERSNKRMIVISELSINGESLGDQVKRARCQMRWGDGPETRSEWYADWVSVSMSLDKAWVFLSYPRFSQARIVGRFPRHDLERLASYFEQSSHKIIEVPEKYEIPLGCDDFYEHP